MVNKPRSAAHWRAIDRLFAEVATTVRQRRGTESAASLGVTRTDLRRVESGTAGFATVVKVVQALGGTVEVVVRFPTEVRP